MLEALGWGLLAQSSLLIAGLLVCWVTVPTKVVGILGGFGAGAMIAAVSFDLLPEAQVHIEARQTGLWMMLGVGVFLVADQFVERRFGSEGAGGAMGIVVGFRRRRRSGIHDPRHPGRNRYYDQSRLRRRGIHLEYAASNCALG